MKAFTFGLVFLLVGLAEAKLDQKSIAEIFTQGQEPSPPQGKIKWKCMHDTDGDNSGRNCASNYGFQSDGSNFKVPDFGMPEDGRVAFEKKNNALVFTQRNKEGIMNHLAIRSFVTSAGPRLIMEESTTFPAWQTPGKKSSITGVTPNVYVICAPEAEFNSFMIGKTSSSNDPNSARPVRTTQ